jgi:hypothetical protein
METSEILARFLSLKALEKVVTPVQTWVKDILKLLKLLDSDFRRKDRNDPLAIFYEFIIFKSRIKD